MSGKGSSPRPYSVPMDAFDKNFDAIFGKKAKEEKHDETDSHTEQKAEADADREGSH